MSLTLLAKGVLLGFAIAAPVGPIGLLCINRTLERGFLAGVAGGLGTALADAAYALLAATGFSLLAAVLQQATVPLGLAGGVFMVWLGVKSFAPKPAAKAAATGARDLVGTTAATFALTVTNPATIFSFAAIFAGLGLAEADGPGRATVVAGVFCGSMLWWVLLSGGVALAHRRLPEGFALWTARLSGIVLIGFGVAAMATALYVSGQ